MWLLRSGHDHDDGRSFARQPKAESRSNHRGPEREYLPMLRVWEHSQSGPARRAIIEGGQMNTRSHELEFTEPERYELHQGPIYHFEISRREFVQVLGAGILISVALPTARAQRVGGDGPTNLAQRLHIGADGVITVFTSKVEVGQG